MLHEQAYSYEERERERERERFTPENKGYTNISNCPLSTEIYTDHGLLVS